MKIYIVSCNPPRVERLLKAAEPLNLDFEVVDSPLGTDPEVQARGKDVIANKRGYPTGIAATIGHIRAMERIASRDDSYALIIEDDVRFHTRFNEYIIQLEAFVKTRPCDILSIGFLSIPRRIKSFPYFSLELMENVEVSNPWGAQAYIISKSYAMYFSKRFGKGNLYYNYKGDFVTDNVMFDPGINCKRSSLIIPIVIESPNEQTLAGNVNKPPIHLLGVNINEFYL